MAKPDKPLLSFGARGTIADSLTFQKRGKGSATIAREKPIPTDPRSEAQLAQRQKYRDAVDAWHALSPEEKEAWRGVCPGLTAYPCFIRSELRKVVPPPEEYTEEQTQYDTETDLYAGFFIYVGQRLTIPNRRVTKLGFWLRKYASPAGNVTYQVRKVIGDVLITEKVLCDASDLPTETTYEEVTFDTPTIVNEEVRIVVYFPHGNASNTIKLSFKNANVKDAELFTRYLSAPWQDFATADTAYRYKYYEV